MSTFITSFDEFRPIRDELFRKAGLPLDGSIIGAEFGFLTPETKENHPCLLEGLIENITIGNNEHADGDRPTIMIGVNATRDFDTVNICDLFWQEKTGWLLRTEDEEEKGSLEIISKKALDISLPSAASPAPSPQAQVVLRVPSSELGIGTPLRLEMVDEGMIVQVSGGYTEPKFYWKVDGKLTETEFSNEGWKNKYTALISPQQGKQICQIVELL